MDSTDPDRRLRTARRAWGERDLAVLVADQAGIVARRQLTATGVDRDAVEANIAARRSIGW
ncbi:hypothetical protein [Nocardioides plantarum]|uniref:Uncharacterized protein n=1 Tax=Nocardioides plantarum TaxID=29299 RepID=A0ABV5KF83_9ACTN|nr:hypothetical protein [Nocardioides plantarum]